MQTKITIAVLTCILTTILFVIGDAKSQDFGPMHFLQQGTYALDPEIDEGYSSHRVATYLPPTTLVFLVDERTRTIRDLEYQRIITQHGQDLLVLRKAISRTDFRSMYGNQNIIFHQNWYMCPQDHKNCREGIDITRGDVLQLLDYGEFVHLKTVKITGEISGYLPKERFDQFKYGGVLSDASQHYPRYLHVDTKRIDSLCTKCGQTKKDIDVTRLGAELRATVEPTGFFAFLKDIFSIQATGYVSRENQDVVEASYGGTDIAMEFFVVTIQEPDNEGRFNKIRSFNITSEVKCIMPARRKIFIERVSVNQGKEFVGMISFDSLYGIERTHLESPNERSPQYEVYRLNKRRVFFNSINSTKQYESAIKQWTNQVYDVSIAHILMSELNASCPERDERGNFVRDLCSDLLPVN